MKDALSAAVARPHATLDGVLNTAVHSRSAQPSDVKLQK